MTGVTPEVETVDPAMLSMTDRKKLFEKNKSVPTPVARLAFLIIENKLSEKVRTIYNCKVGTYIYTYMIYQTDQNIRAEG